MRILIIAGGAAPSKELMLKEFNKSDFVICADKGGEYLTSINKLPDMLLGDFDSIAEETLREYEVRGVLLEKYPREKNFTDTEMCVMKALEREPDTLVLLGCLGSRLDHIMGNIGLLRLALEKKVRAFIKDDNNIIYLADNQEKINCPSGQIISFQAFTEEVKNLTVTSVKYPLMEYDLKSWSSYTVSNVVEKEVNISFTHGILIILLSKD